MMGKADALHQAEGSSPWSEPGELLGHHRGLGTGHAYKGVARELGRANCLLAKIPENKVDR